MSNCHRLPYAALGGYLAVFLLASSTLAGQPLNPQVKAETPSGPESKTESGNAKAPEQDSKPSTVIPVPATKSYQNPCETAETREEHDLCQQWRMAKGTEKLVRAAIRQNEISKRQLVIADRQFWATLIEIGLISLATFFAYRAARWAKGAVTETKRVVEVEERAVRVQDRAANEAKEAAGAALDNAREMGQTQVRAYLIFSEVKARWSERETPILSITCSNSGQTPAGNVTITVKCSLNFVFSDKVYSIPNSLKFLEDIGAGKVLEFDLPIDHVVPEEIRSRFRNERSLFQTNLEITYVDVFKQKLRGETRLWGMCQEGRDLDSSGQPLSPQPHTWQ